MKFNILIIDDNKGDMLLIKELLKEAGLDCEIQWAENGEVGLEMIQQKKPDLVFLDAFMPRLNGFEVLEQLKIARNRNMYVIMLTNSLEDVSTLNPNKILADGHCEKRPEHILREISKYLQQKR